MPVISTAFIAHPAMKSSFTARRAHPWKVKRSTKPEPLAKALAASALYMKTLSQGMSTLSSTMMASFSSSLLDSG